MYHITYVSFLQYKFKNVWVWKKILKENIKLSGRRNVSLNQNLSKLE